MLNEFPDKFICWQEAYAAHSIHTQGCVHAIVAEIREHFIIIGIMALGVGFIEVGYRLDTTKVIQCIYSFNVYISLHTLTLFLKIEDIVRL